MGGAPIKKRKIGYKSNNFSRRAIFLYSVLLILTFNHNWIVSGENSARGFKYEAWQTLTKFSNMFDKVEDSDIFVSRNQNDAFENNAGSFYRNSGVRLAYMYNTKTIFPYFDDCSIDTNCKLTEIRKKTFETLSNLTRGFVPLNVGEIQSPDWVDFNISSGVDIIQTIWAFDVFLLTPDTFVSYLAPFIENETNSEVNFNELKVTTVTKLSTKESSPSIAGICLIRNGASDSYSDLLMTEWSLPTFKSELVDSNLQFDSVVDYRELQFGICGD